MNNNVYGIEGLALSTEPRKMIINTKLIDIIQQGGENETHDNIWPRAVIFVNVRKYPMQAVVHSPS